MQCDTKFKIFFDIFFPIERFIFFFLTEKCSFRMFKKHSLKLVPLFQSESVTEIYFLFYSNRNMSKVIVFPYHYGFIFSLVLKNRILIPIKSISN